MRTRVNLLRRNLLSRKHKYIHVMYLILGKTKRKKVITQYLSIVKWNPRRHASRHTFNVGWLRKATECDYIVYIVMYLFVAMQSHFRWFHWQLQRIGHPHPTDSWSHTLGRTRMICVALLLLICSATCSLADNILPFRHKHKFYGFAYVKREDLLFGIECTSIILNISTFWSRSNRRKYLISKWVLAL